MSERNEQAKDLARGTRVEVEVWWEDRDGAWRSEVVRFTGKLVDGYEDRYGTQFDLYECPGGYRVFVYGEGGAHLHPFEVGRNDEGFEYGLYGAEEVTIKYPPLGSTVGHPRIGDLG
ncbi:MAG: hypothetical protein CYG60_21550 [Actinobacteria bacterium]|nr:MAG: hypothetical protein CYG60_21550 [Actinomycetota bacterium]